MLLKMTFTCEEDEQSHSSEVRGQSSSWGQCDITPRVLATLPGSLSAEIQELYKEKDLRATSQILIAVVVEAIVLAAVATVAEIVAVVTVAAAVAMVVLVVLVAVS